MTIPAPESRQKTKGEINQAQELRQLKSEFWLALKLAPGLGLPVAYAYDYLADFKIHIDFFSTHWIFSLSMYALGTCNAFLITFLILNAYHKRKRRRYHRR